MPVPLALLEALQSPSPDALWRLRGDLLARGVDPDHRAVAILGGFRTFLDALATSIASRDLSELASRMDIASLGGVVGGDLPDAAEGGELARRLLTAVLAEGLAVLATRQHVKAWRGELEAVFRDAAWLLYGELWRWAERRRPELDPGERRRLLDGLFAAVRGAAIGDPERAVVFGRLFQLLLVDALADATASG